MYSNLGQVHSSKHHAMHLGQVISTNQLQGKQALETVFNCKERVFQQEGGVHTVTGSYTGGNHSPNLLAQACL